MVLVDLGLPRMSGSECIRLLADRLPSTAFLVLSAFHDDERILEALRAGAVGFLHKGEAEHAICQAIREAVRGGSPMTPSIARRVVAHFHRSAARVATAAEPLSLRERQVVEAMARGLRYKEIASQLSLSEFTVRTYMRRVYRKLQAASQAEVIRRLFGR